MFWAAHRSSSGAPNRICSLWFIYPCPGWVGTAVPTQSEQRSVTTCVYKPEAANTVWSSWWWAICRSKNVEPSINFWNNNFYYKVTSCWLFLLIHITMHASMNIKFRTVRNYHYSLRNSPEECSSCPGFIIKNYAHVMCRKWAPLCNKKKFLQKEFVRRVI